MDDDPFNQRKERGFDAITLLLAGLLTAIVVGAVGYGIVKSSKVASVPLLTGHYQPSRVTSPSPAGQQAREKQAQDAQVTTGTSDARQ
jgi:hypothetical protein